jgi:anaerobic selenocysteine-containing dehydrogenase
MIGPQRSKASEMTERKSFCRFCGSFCAVIATVENDTITAVRGDPDDPVSKGYICAKGAALGKFHHHPDRLNQPMVRKDGALVPADWASALDDIADTVRGIIDRYGVSAVGSYAGTPSVPCASVNVWRAFMAKLGTPSVYSTISVDIACAPLVSEHICGTPMLSSQPDMDAHMTILIGVNPAVSHGHVFFMAAPVAQMRRWVDQGELWVVDPRRSESADIANHHLALWPGSEYALLGHAVRELLRDGCDEAFLAEYVTGLEELREAVERFTLAETVAATRLPAEEVTAFVAAIRRAGRIAIHPGTGVSFGRNANVTTFMTWALHAVTGSLDRHGGAYFNPGFVRNMDRDGWTPGGATGPGPASRPDLPSRLGEYPCAALIDEIEAGNLRALFIFAGNPIIALPDTNRLTKALAKLDLLVVIDVVENATTPFATHLLPSSGQLEMADMVLWDFLTPSEFSRYAPRVVEPSAERKPVWWIMRELSGRLGMDIGLPADVAHDDDVMRSMLPTSRASFDEIKASPHGLGSGKRTYEWLHRFLPNGRFNFGPPALIEQLAQARVSEDDMLLISRRQKHHMNGQMSEGIANPRRPDQPLLLINPEDAAERGIADGENVSISTETGSVTAQAKLDDRYRRGVVSLPHGFGEVNVNILTNNRDVDRLSGMVTLGAFGVRVEKAG